jgi:hypothetical protein
MTTTTSLLATLFLLLASAPMASAQLDDSPNIAAGPPKVLLVVHQQIKFGHEDERRKLEISLTRACDRLDVPNSWIDLESLTGEPEALFFDPFDSFEHLEKAAAGWGQLFLTHPDLARMQQQIKTLVTSEKTIVAVRRDDLGFRPQSIDLSKARFLRVLEVRLHPGYESEFVEAFKTLADAYEKIKADTPWVVYQVNVGMPTPTFLVIVPLRALKQNDDLLNWRKSIREAEGEEAIHRTEEIARGAYDSTESNLYAISPEMSHVSKDFAGGDLEFWSPNPPRPKDAKP